MAARMIPSLGPAEYDDRSREGEIYYALSKLPDDFTVIHSYKMLDIVDGNAIEQREADFIVFNRKLGILVIEAKAGRIRCENGEWLYGSGVSMRRHGGPYRQADSIKWKLINRFEDVGLRELCNRCKVAHAVWLPSLGAHELGFIDYSPEASRDITLCKTDLGDPTEQIVRIMSMDVGGRETRLSNAEAKEVLHKVLLPEFDIVPTNSVDYRYNDFVFARLLDSQARVLNFIKDQKTAVINGAAGTGKTLIAIERARQAACTGRVLFLCFNSLLKEEITRRCNDVPEIDVYTIPGYACKVCNSLEPNYASLTEELMEHPDSFPYQHIVIDEGQDFGLKAIEDAMVLETLRSIVDSRPESTMYLFYDKRQFVQGSTMPSFLMDADCKLTLYVNCRNTEAIEKSSLSALGEAHGFRMQAMARLGKPPLLMIDCDAVAQEAFVDKHIDLLKNAGINDIVVITCKTLENSKLSSCFTGDQSLKRWKGQKVPVHTVRKIKGMEAAAVIMIDVDQALWEQPSMSYMPEPGTLFYTAASRARHELRIVCDMNEDACNHALVTMGVKANRRPAKKLANVLGAVLVG